MKQITTNTYHSRGDLNSKATNAELRRVTVTGLIVNLALSFLKFFLGIWGHSSALIADAAHSLSDIVSDVAILFGLPRWSTPPDREHPYGHQRIETVLTLMIGFALAMTAVFLLVRATGSLLTGIPRQPQPLVLIGALTSILAKEILFRWTLSVGNSANSSAVIANAWHHRSDAFSSIPVAAAIVLAVQNPQWAWLDPAGAAVVSIMLLKAAWNIVKPAANALTDASDGESQNRISQMSKTVNGVKDVHAVRVRALGSSKHVDLHVLVNDNLTVKAGHDIATAVKNYLIDNGPNVVDVVVHVEPESSRKKPVQEKT